MSKVPKKIEERFKSKTKQYRKILDTSKARDINESDTVTIVKDMLSDIFGYDKYQEITSEYSVRGTYCDLAVKMEDKPHILIEVKAIGLDLKDIHLRQATDYASKEGIDWVILTNGILWKLHRVVYSKPVANEFVFDIDFSELNLRDPSEMDKLFLLTKEAANKDAISVYHKERQLKNKHILSAILTHDSIVDSIRKIFNRLSKDVRITNDEISKMLTNDLLKREVIEGDMMKQATATVKRLLQKRASRDKKELAEPEGTIT